MGFGLLFLGYFFMFNFPYKGLDVFPDVLGFVINIFAFKKLSEYRLGFEILQKLNYFLLIPSSALSGLQIYRLVSGNSVVLDYFEPVYVAFILFYNVYLLSSVYRIAVDAGSLSVAARAQRNLVLTFIYFAIEFFNILPFDFARSSVIYLNNYGYGFGCFVLKGVWLFLNLVLIYSCHMRIIPEGSEENE